MLREKKNVYKAGHARQCRNEGKSENEFSLRKFVRTRPNFFMHKRRVRMEEIMREENCIFCKILADEIPSAVVYEDDDCRAILDNAPQQEGM